MQLQINRISNVDMALRQVKLLGSIYAQGIPETLIGYEAGLSDQDVTALLEMPLISHVLEKYNEAFEVPFYQKGDVQIVIKKHLPSGETISGWTQETIYIPG